MSTRASPMPRRTPARTVGAGSPAGLRWKEMYERGGRFYGWDGHSMHFVGGIATRDDGSPALYGPRSPPTAPPEPEALRTSCT